MGSVLYCATYSGISAVFDDAQGALPVLTTQLTEINYTVLSLLKNRCAQM